MCSVEFRILATRSWIAIGTRAATLVLAAAACGACAVAPSPLGSTIPCPRQPSEGLTPQLPAIDKHSAGPATEGASPEPRAASEFDTAIAVSDSGDHAWQRHIESVLRRQSIEGEWGRLGPQFWSFQVTAADAVAAKRIVDWEAALRGRSLHSSCGTDAHLDEGVVESVARGSGVAKEAVRKVLEAVRTEVASARPRLALRRPVVCDMSTDSLLLLLRERAPGLAAIVEWAVAERGDSPTGRVAWMRADVEYFSSGAPAFAETLTAGVAFEEKRGGVEQALWAQATRTSGRWRVSRLSGR